MNCCDTYGTCTQGRDCPARTGTVLPHQAAHACRVAKVNSTRPGWMNGKARARTCDALGVCQGCGDCTCSHPKAPETGAFQIVDLGPDDDFEPLSHDDSMALVRSLLVWLVCVAAVVMLVSFGTERFSDLLWSVLGALS